MEIVGYDIPQALDRGRGFATGPLPPRRRVRGSLYFLLAVLELISNSPI